MLDPASVSIRLFHNHFLSMLGTSCAILILVESITSNCMWLTAAFCESQFIANRFSGISSQNLTRVILESLLPKAALPFSV